jgi:hypothetical protein
MDCSGTWGGSLVNDECGACGGDGLGTGSYYMDCWDGIEYCSNSDCPIDPSLVSYNIYRSGLGIPIAEVQGATGYTDLDLGYNEQYCYTVTYVNNDVESHHSNQACAITESMPIIDGCMSTYACNYDESATVDDGSCWFVNTGCSCDAGQSAETDNCGVCDTDSSNDCIPDCNGDWGGPDNIANSGDEASYDECGICDGDNFTCADCDGVPNGNNVVDNCGVCDIDPTNDCTSDCNGDWGGTAAIDSCGICDSDSTNDNLCNDCNGNPFGDAYIDDCVQCVGGTTGLDPCIIDCSGIPDGDAYIDDCGVCYGDNSSCADCCGVLNGDGDTCDGECGPCDDDIDEGTCDCDGNVLDACNVCGGDNTSCSWTNLTASVENTNQIALSWDAVDSRSSGGRGSSGDRSSECNSEVCLSIENVDTDVGTLDIYMTNTAGCSSCDDNSFDNQIGCEVSGNNTAGGTWTFDATIDEATCESSTTNWGLFRWGGRWISI